MLAKVGESKEKSYGYHAATGEYKDLVKAGVIDEGESDRRRAITSTC